jgi:hypothetical protein
LALTFFSSTWVGIMLTEHWSFGRLVFVSLCQEFRLLFFRAVDWFAGLSFCLM